MEDTCPPFLQALGLDAQADERAVRRAYAKRLKAIDPATEPMAFQVLREAYEISLRWISQRAAAPPAAAGPAPEPPATDASPAPAAEAPPPGVAVFEAFAQQAARVFVDEPAARAALEAALGDEQLINLEARALFEWNVGCLLMNGWQPGHEFLFGPACEVFAWAHDRRRLTLFGNLGAAIDQAIHEKNVFFSQPEGQFEVQRRLVRRLRDGTPPSDGSLRVDMPLVQTLAQRYPSWLRAITSGENIRRWHERYEQLPGAKYEAAAPAAVPRATPFEPEKPASRPWMGLIWLMVMLGAIASFLGRNTASRPPLSSPATWQAPAARPAPPGFPPVLAPDPGLSFEQAATTSRPGVRPNAPARSFKETDPMFFDPFLAPPRTPASAPRLGR